MMNWFLKIVDHIYEFTGPASTAKSKMYTICELSEDVQSKINELIKKMDLKKNDPIYKYNKSSKYGKLDLEILDKAILQAFDNELSLQEKQILEVFKPKRNMLLLAGNNISEAENAVDSIETNQTFEAFKREAAQANESLDKLIRICKERNKKPMLL
jgi:hypothetical protein